MSLRTLRADTRFSGTRLSVAGSSRTSVALIGLPAMVPARVALSARLGRAPVRLQRRLEPGRIRHRGPADAFDRQRCRTRRGLGRLPRIALPTIAREEGRGEHVAGTGGIRFDRATRTQLVPVTVDVEERAA